MSGVDPAGVASERSYRVAHRGEVDDGGDAGEVLEEHPRGREGDLARRLGRCIPRRDRFHVLACDGVAVLAPQKVLEQDPSVHGSRATS